VITNRNLDVLVMVDNSSSMLLPQANLRTNFPMFIDALKALPGGLPNLHLAVISSDMGAGMGPSPAAIARRGYGHSPVHAARDVHGVAVDRGRDLPVKRRRQVNYTARHLGGVLVPRGAGRHGLRLRAPVRVGVARAGCRRGAGAGREPGLPAPRCAAGDRHAHQRGRLLGASGVALFDTASNTTLSSQLGPPANFRCNEFGHLCDGVPPVRKAPGGSVTATVPLQNCVASECGGALTPVAEFVARIKALKAAPASEIVVAAITGPVTPYVVQWKNPSTNDTGPWPIIGHSCTAADASFADPGVRIAAGGQRVRGERPAVLAVRHELRAGAAADRVAHRHGAGGGRRHGGGPPPIPACPPDGGTAEGGRRGRRRGAGGTTGAGGAATRRGDAAIG
jgi:hypothetical protein